MSEGPDHNTWQRACEQWALALEQLGTFADSREAIRWTNDCTTMFYNVETTSEAEWTLYGVAHPAPWLLGALWSPNMPPIGSGLDTHINNYLLFEFARINMQEYLDERGFNDLTPDDAAHSISDDIFARPQYWLENFSANVQRYRNLPPRVGMFREDSMDPIKRMRPTFYEFLLLTADSTWPLVEGEYMNSWRTDIDYAFSTPDDPLRTAWARYWYDQKYNPDKYETDPNAFLFSSPPISSHMQFIPENDSYFYTGSGLDNEELLARAWNYQVEHYGIEHIINRKGEEIFFNTVLPAIFRHVYGEEDPRVAAMADELAWTYQQGLTPDTFPDTVAMFLDDWNWVEQAWEEQRNYNSILEFVQERWGNRNIDSPFLDLNEDDLRDPDTGRWLRGEELYQQAGQQPLLGDDDGAAEETQQEIEEIEDTGAAERETLTDTGFDIASFLETAGKAGIINVVAASAGGRLTLEEVIASGLAAIQAAIASMPSPSSGSSGSETTEATSPGANDPRRQGYGGSGSGGKGFMGEEA
jgi:hypothetical protein